MKRVLALAALGAVALSATAGVDGANTTGLTFFAPDVTVSPAEQKRLHAGETVVRVSARSDGLLSLTAIVRVNASGERLAAWAASVEELQRGRYVPEIGRFSQPPRIEDLDGLTIEPDDLDDMAGCRPGDCGVKLSGREIEQLKGLRDRAARGAAFKRALVQRAAAYLQRGDAAIPPYHDDDEPVSPPEIFRALVGQLAFFNRNLPRFAEYLRTYPQPRAAPVEQQLLYWSKERLGMKPVVSITHSNIARFTDSAMPETVVVAKQVYATHYKNAAITVTSLVAHEGTRYLVYVNRSNVDAFHGFFGPVVRRVVERRVRGEAPGVLTALRRRLESGPPQAVAVP